jgi:branched-chain amino acid transport system substrate-binding protein
MFNIRIDRRRLISVATIALLAACKAAPGGNVAPPPPPPPPEGPSANVLPTDAERHRVALLVPLTGANGAVGQSIANAATMAILDSNAQNLRITTYDTALGGSAAAASRAVADGNKLILGPLMSEDIPGVVTAARAAKVPVISYSNDEGRAARDTFIMGNLPSASLARTLSYARSQGMTRFAALVPMGEYGQRISTAMTASVRTQGLALTAVESFDRSAASVTAAARRLKAKGGYEAVLIADGGRISAMAGPALVAGASAAPRILGTELWSGEAVVTATPSLAGAWYSSISDANWRQLTTRYRSRFGTQPYRVASLGYDSVLLTLRVAREWRPGTAFPTARMFDRGGFGGVDGAFRFLPSGAIDRALEVRQVRAGGVDVVSAAPDKFGD